MIPVYQATLQYEDDGIFAISLVDCPAVESKFLAFTKNDKPMHFAVQDEMERKVIGVIMRCDYQIYRYDETLGEYYIVYSKQTIEEMARRMMKTGAYKQIDLDHDGKMIEGVELLEVFIKNSAKGIDPAGFDDISDGSLFGVFKITDDNIWNDILAGKYMGYSLEGYFTPKKVDNYKNTISEKTMKKINRYLFAVLKFGQVHTDNGTVYWVGEDDLKIGDELFMEDENGDRIKVEDGTYTTDNGTKITVEGGLVTDIEEPVVTEYRKVTKLEGETEEETPVEDIVEEVIDEVEETIEEVVEEKIEEVVEETITRDLEAEIDALKEELQAIKETLAEVLQTPAAEPVEEDFKKTKKSIIPAFGSKHTLVGF